MKCASFIVRGVVAAAMVALVPNAAAAQTVSPGPYYATPSWDQKLVCDSPSNCPRFIVLTNWNSGAVLDRETGLVWERAPLAPCLTPLCTTLEDGFRTFSAADVYCSLRITGNRAGWRLPSRLELSSLMDFDPANTSNLILPLGHPFLGVEPFHYWSATTLPGDALAWTVSFSRAGFVFRNGLFIDAPAKTAGQGVWCVRAGTDNVQ